MPNPFITRDELGTYLGLSLTSDAKALQCVETACDVIRTITGQTFTEVASDVITLDGSGTDALLLPQLPVSSVSTVVELTASASTTYAAGVDYKLNGNGVLLRMPTIVENGWNTGTCVRGWTKGRQNFTVTYTHGYASADMPDDIKGVAISIAARLYQSSGGSVISETLGAYSVRYSDPGGGGIGGAELTGTEKIILRKYRRAR